MKILYFAWVRETVGRAEEEIELPLGVTTVAGLIDWLCARGDGAATAFADLSVIRVAVNQEHVGVDHLLRSGDEVAFFPPVTGGVAGAVME
ncbi:MAG: molybdopterin converting factor subunit 1 [Hyphomicrobiales bacterium]|nr:molybdopterin converting factor subunit 1 [Hyphomicrobiales bacterium]